MGFGELGQDAARKLKVMGFDVAGWSRTPKIVDGFTDLRGRGRARRLPGAHRHPRHPAAADVRDARHHQPRSAAQARPGRAARRPDPDQCRSRRAAGRGGHPGGLDDGTLKAATLDVFETEPLPAEWPLWAHPRVLISPHNAATSDPGRHGPLHRRADPPTRSRAGIPERRRPASGLLKVDRSGTRSELSGGTTCAWTVLPRGSVMGVIQLSSIRRRGDTGQV